MKETEAEKIKLRFLGTSMHTHTSSLHTHVEEKHVHADMP